MSFPLAREYRILREAVSVLAPVRRDPSVGKLLSAAACGNPPGKRGGDQRRFVPAVRLASNQQFCFR